MTKSFSQIGLIFVFVVFLLGLLQYAEKIRANQESAVLPRSETVLVSGETFSDASSPDIISSKVSGALQVFAKNVRSAICEEEGEVYVLEFLSCARQIGSSLQNRPIYVFDIGGGPLKVLFIGGLYTGTEENTRILAGEVLKYFLRRPEEIPGNVTLHIIPRANPDGSAKGVHDNARNVDLNSNWPSGDWRSDPYRSTYGRVEGAGGAAPLSEPETKAVYDFIIKERPKIIFVWHAQAGAVQDNNTGFADALSKVYATAAGYRHVTEWTYSEATGTISRAMAERGISVITVELASRETEFERNLKGVKAVFEHMGSNYSQN